MADLAASAAASSAKMESSARCPPRSAFCILASVDAAVEEASSFERGSREVGWGPFFLPKENQALRRWVRGRRFLLVEERERCCRLRVVDGRDEAAGRCDC